MRVNYVVNPIEGGWSPWDTRIGGSEEMVVETARRLSERGHETTVYHNGRHGRLLEVAYRERAEYDARQPGVTVNVNYPDLPVQEPTIYWTSLYPETRRDLGAFKQVCALSEWQVEHSGIKHHNVSLLPPGYDSLQVRPENKIPQTVLYASAPSRGLDELRRVWPDVVKVRPQAQLIVTYGAALDLPNCMNLGEVSSEEMNELFNTADIWCHPATGHELYCISGIKAQAAGCWPVYYPHMALAETVKYGTATNPQYLARDLIAALGSHDTPRRVHLPDWERTTDILETTLAKYA